MAAGSDNDIETLGSEFGTPVRVPPARAVSVCVASAMALSHARPRALSKRRVAL